MPSKPFRLVSVSIVFAQRPSGIVTLPGFADRVKSGVAPETGLANAVMLTAITIKDRIMIDL